MPKHGHCLGKRRKGMLHFLLFKSLFHNERKRKKYPFHRKQSVFKRRGVSPGSSGVPERQCSSLSPALLPQFHSQAGQEQGQGIISWSKVSEAHSFIWDSTLLPLPTWWGRQPAPARPWRWSNLSCFSMDHWSTKI